MCAGRTRREVLCVSTGLGLALTAGCLSDSDAASDDDTGNGNDADGDETGNGADDEAAHLTAQDVLLETAAWGDFDATKLEFEAFDLTAIDAVSRSLPDGAGDELRGEAFDLVSGADELLGAENVETTFAFEVPNSYESHGRMRCEGLLGSFDVASVRSEIDVDDDQITRRTVAGFDLYTETSSTGRTSWLTALGSELVLDIEGDVDADEVETLLEGFDSGQATSEVAEYATLEAFVGSLDGAVVFGELAPTGQYGENGFGVSLDLGAERTVVRYVFFYDDGPTEDVVERIESDLEGEQPSSEYDETSVDADDRAVVVSFAVETERFDLRNW